MKTTLAFVCAAALSQVAFAQSVVNGDFSLEVPGNSTGNGWTGFSNDGAGGWRSSGGNPGGYFIMNDGGASATDPSISQTINGFVPGGLYRLTGDFASWIVSNAPFGGASFAVDINGTQVFTGLAGTLQEWRSFQVDFTAPDTGIVTIRFRAEINGTDNDFAIDNIAVAAIPTPATGAGLLGLSLLAMGRRRR
ncbi:MAG: hypothetical protein IBJ18_04275 [Phycisphaerales bacterium]|nr:hypothetical protein [Phycisphaerales bacterium]